MYAFKENMYMWKHSVDSKDLEKELLKIFKGEFSVTNMKKYAPDPYSLKNDSYKPYYRFRIMEYGTRVEDVSFFNFKLKTYGDGTIEFQRPNSTKLNWLHFKGKCDIIFDDANRQIIIDVQDLVYYKTGKRRYEDRPDITDGVPLQIKNREEYLKGIKVYFFRDYFLEKRTITGKSMRHVEREIARRNSRRNK